jgi:hypothetical protein
VVCGLVYGYYLKSDKDVPVYVGRTLGFASPEAVLIRRHRQHLRGDIRFDDLLRKDESAFELRIIYALTCDTQYHSIADWSEIRAKIWDAETHLIKHFRPAFNRAGIISNRGVSVRSRTHYHYVAPKPLKPLKPVCRTVQKSSKLATSKSPRIAPSLYLLTSLSARSNEEMRLYNEQAILSRASVSVQGEPSKIGQQ